MRASGLPLCEPEQTCEACGASGTVGRAMRTNQEGYPSEIHRFCAPCWPEHSARYRARWQEEDRLARQARFRDPLTAKGPIGGTAFESATWHGALEFLECVNQTLRPSQTLTASDLAAIAAQLTESAATHVGEMPFEIEHFIREHGAQAG